MKMLIVREIAKVLRELTEIVEKSDSGKIEVGEIRPIAKKAKYLLLKLDHLKLAVVKEVEAKRAKRKVIKHRKA